MTRAILLTLVIATAPALPAIAQDDCRQQIEEARRAYAEGGFDQVLELTARCVADRATSEDAAALRARTFVALDRIRDAEAAVASLLAINPQFSPRSDDTRAFAALVARVSRELLKSATSSVSKMSETLLEAPATVIVVTADQIKRRGYLDVEALLHDLPGFDIARTNGQNYSNIYQRGYRSDATNRTLLLVDGVEQNDVYSNIAHISRQYPLSNIDRVEVVYGPASTMYGANAFLGVINVITKEPDDLIDEGKRFGADVQVGGGAWGTGTIDATVAGRFRNATFSLTARAYRSNEYDLSGFTSWSYDTGQLATPFAFQQYLEALPAFDSGLNFVLPEPGDIPKAAAFDGRAILAGVAGSPLRYSDVTDDRMVSAKLKVSGFLIGFESWRRREGAASSATALKEPDAASGNVWIPSQSSAYVRFNSALSGNLSLSYFGQAKVHRLERGSAAFSFYNYIAGPLNILDLNAGVQPYFATTLLQQSSNQFRNEVNLVYRFKNKLSVIGGIDLRNGSIQSNYSSSTNCALQSSVFTPYSQKTADQLVSAVLAPPIVDATGEPIPDTLFESFVLRLIDLTVSNPRALPRCTRTADFPGVAPVTAGGEHFAVRDIGEFAQVTYKPVPALKLVAGLRIDNDQVEPIGGFGTVAMPRLAVVYAKRGFVLKTIYSEAFKDASSLERFSTVPGIRDVASPRLRPERAKNLEVGGGRQWPSFSLDVAVFRSAYSNLITLRNRNMGNNTSICRERDTVGFCIAGPLSDAINHTLEYLEALVPSSPPDATALAQKKLTDLFAGLSAPVFDDFFNAPLVTSQYVNAGALRIWGLQASASGQLRGVDLFGNYSYSSPYNVAPTDEFGTPLPSGTRLRVADIATHHVNAGAAGRWRRFDGSVRVNFVGARPTGTGTTVFDPLRSESGTEAQAYTIANVTLGYAVGRGLTAQVIVNNLFDSTYWDPGVGTADGVRFAATVPQPGRSAFVRLLARF